MTTEDKKYYTKLEAYNRNDSHFLSIHGDNERLSRALGGLEYIRDKKWEVSGEDLPFYGRVMSVMEELRVLACGSIRKHTEDCILEQIEDSLSKVKTADINRFFEGRYYDPKTNKHVRYKLEDLPIVGVSANSDNNPPPIYPLVIKREDKTLEYLIRIIKE